MMKSYLNSEKMNRFLNFTVLASVKTRLAMIVLLVALFSNIGSLSAATYYSRATGNWNARATWSTTSGGTQVATGVFPVAGDVVVIERGYTVTVNISNAACASLQLGGTATNSAGTLLFSGTSPSLTVSGAVKIGNSGNTARDGSITFKSDATLIASSITLGGTAATSGQGTIIMTLGGTINVGSLTVGTGSGTWTSGIGTVIMNATNTLPSTIFTSFNNLIISGGVTTTGRSLTIASLSAQSAGEFKLSHTVTASKVELEAGCAVAGGKISGSSVLTLGDDVNVTNNGGGIEGAVISCPVDLNNDRTFTIADDGTTAADLTISGIISGSSDDITKLGLGTLVLSAANTFSGKTSVTEGTLTLEVADALGGTSEVNLLGGKLVNLAASQIVDAILDVDKDSSIDLGTGSLTFNDSTGKTWDDDSNVLTTLTIYGWTGLDGSGQFFIKDKSDGTSGINSEQLSQIKFSGYGTCGATIIDKGNYVEVVPVSFSIKPTVTITQPTCTLATGSVVLTGLPTSGTLKQNDGTVTTTISYTGNSKTIPVLVSGKTYSYTVSNGSCDSSPVNVTISPVATNTWNGTSWSPNTPTDVLHLDQNIVFEGDYGDNKNLYGCSCEVKSGNVVIHENYTLKVTNEVKVTGGSLTFLNTASLVQTNDVANTGNITYNRTTPTVRPTDYVYWSSPVSGQTIANFSPTVGSIKYYYDLGWKAPSDSDVMVKGLGYIIRGQVTSNDKYDASFVGVPNNGPVAITANTAAKYYLVGNPYPSAIDADEFLDQNAGLDGNVYLWTHNTEIAKNAAGTEMVYTSDDYANYNFTGSTSTFKSEECKTCPNNAKPIGKIAAGQSFFVKTISATTIQFNNDMRLESKDKIDNSDQNSQFFRTTNTNTTKSKTAVVEKHRLWLNLTNNQGAFKQTLIGYVTGATNDLDARYDGQNFNGNAFINFYSINQNKNFTIQGRALPFDESDEVALGFKSTMKGSFTIAIDEVDGLLANQAVFIEDKLKGTTFNLKTGNYTFDTEEGTFNERFVIRYINRTLATEDFTIAPNKVLVSVKNKQMKIIAAETIDKVVVYDLLGREIYTKTAVNSNELVVSNLVSGQQALVVKVVLQNGSSSTKKIVY